MIKIIIGEVPVLPLLIMVFKVNKLSGINKMIDGTPPVFMKRMITFGYH